MGETGNLLIKIGVKIFNALNNRHYRDLTQVIDSP
jgi:hypothetical protein